MGETRNVRGALFVDYVRMIRGHKDIDWSAHLDSADMLYLEGRIGPQSWYPMGTFERMGNAILTEIGDVNLAAVRMWGRLSVGPLRSQYPELVQQGDPMETMARFMVLRKAFFDFNVFNIEEMSPNLAKIAISFQMGHMAEEAASHQSMGFFEGVLELAGAQEIEAELSRQRWSGDARTVLLLRWVE